MKALQLWPSQKGCAQLKSGSLCFIPPEKGLVGNVMGRTHTFLSLGTAKHASYSALCYQPLHIMQSKSPIIHCLFFAPSCGKR